MSINKVLDHNKKVYGIPTLLTWRPSADIENSKTK